MANVYSAVGRNKFSPLIVRPSEPLQWGDPAGDTSGTPRMLQYDAKKVTVIRDFLDANGNSNPDFKFTQKQRVIDGGSSFSSITRGYIRRTDDTDPGAGKATLNFMFNPEQITRDYVSYMDQAALDPFNTLYQSGNLVAPPSFVNFTFSLFFDRQDDMFSQTGVSYEAAKTGCLIDYKYFDIVVRNVPPDGRSTSDVPDNGVMMVNPRDITVVFSKDLTVQGRPTNARVQFTKFNHEMVPTRMQVDLTMIITYFGPYLKTPYGMNTFKAEKKYEAMVPYSDSVEEGYSSEDLQRAIGEYKSLQASRAAAPDEPGTSFFDQYLSAQSSSAAASALGQVGGSVGVSAETNRGIRLAALQRAKQRVSTTPPPSYAAAGGQRTGPDSYDPSGLLWAAYNDIGAAAVLDGQASTPCTVDSIIVHQFSNGWKTMPIVATLGQDHPLTRAGLQQNAQPGDILIQTRGRSGRAAFFVGWQDPEAKTLAIVISAHGPLLGVGQRIEGIAVTCSEYDWVLRPSLGGSQSVGGGVVGSAVIGTSGSYDEATLAEVNSVGGPRSYATALLQVLKTRFAGNAARIGVGDSIYDRRMIRGSSTSWSVHTVGRAVDFGVTTNATGLAFGQALVTELLSKASQLGIQQIIFSNGTTDVSYRPGRAPKAMKSKLHRNHLHIEINRAVADIPTASAIPWIEGVLG